MTARIASLLAALAAALAVGAPAASAETAPPARVATAARAAPSGEMLAMVAPMPRTADREARVSCTPDRAHCVAESTYIPDVCRLIEAAARESGLDRDFFARLLWKESLFDATAVSPAGAQGIAQFMPETAKLRGLGDAFNPAEALVASARYLSELSRDLGNIGLAAVAYNGGEARAARFIAAEAGLPLETRAYVRAITGHSAETWRDAPPASVDLALDKGGDFQAACIARAEARSLREPRAPVLPWGVIVASNRDGAGAERQVARLQNRYAAILRGETVAYTGGRRPGLPPGLHVAQVGRSSRAEAEALCTRLRAAGGDCMVLRN
jgi:Transglycosylase SLT domain/SPOR domain